MHGCTECVYSSHAVLVIIFIFCLSSSSSPVAVHVPLHRLSPLLAKIPFQLAARALWE